MVALFCTIESFQFNIESVSCKQFGGGNIVSSLNDIEIGRIDSDLSLQLPSRAAFTNGLSLQVTRNDRPTAWSSNS